MSLTDSLKRFRPGSGGQGPVSQTSLTIDPTKRRRPRKGLSAPGAGMGSESQSWPVALSNTRDSGGQASYEPERTSDSDDFAPYEPDDEAVLGKLFGLKF